MRDESEKGLNSISAGVVTSSPGDADTPLFARDSWFDALHRGCFAEKRRVTMNGEADCRLPLIETGPGRLSALSNWYSFRWQPVGSGANDPAALRSAFVAARRDAWLIELYPVTTEQGLAAAVAAGARAAGWHVRTRVASESRWVETGGLDFADWWASRPGQLRSTVARKSKKAMVDITIHRNFTAALWEAYEQVYRASWKPDEGQPAFLRDWARAASHLGALRLGVASMAGQPVAAQFWTVEAGTASIHKLAQIAEPAVEAASAGTLLTAALYREAFDVDRVARIDFGTGGDAFKAQWTDFSAPLLRIVALDLARPAAWRWLAEVGASRLAARLHRR